MQTTIGSHVSEELLIRYASGRLQDHAVADVEEHLLVCPSCQSQLEAIDLYLSAGAQAAKEIREEEKLRITRGSSWWRNTSHLAWGVVLAVAMLCTLVVSIRQNSRVPFPPTEVALIASRGAAQAVISLAPGRNVILKTDVSDLSKPVRKLQVVDASGREIWSGPVSPRNQQIRLALPHPLSAGQYWVRLFGDGEIQLREFGLEVE